MGLGVGGGGGQDKHNTRGLLTHHHDESMPITEGSEWLLLATQMLKRAKDIMFSLEIKCWGFQRQGWKPPTTGVRTVLVKEAGTSSGHHSHSCLESFEERRYQNKILKIQRKTKDKTQRTRTTEKQWEFWLAWVIGSMKAIILCSCLLTAAVVSMFHHSLNILRTTVRKGIPDAAFTVSS